MSKIVLEVTDAPVLGEADRLKLVARATGLHEVNAAGEEILLSGPAAVLEHVSGADPHPQYSKVVDLAGPDGATLMGYGSRTVAETLETLGKLHAPGGFTEIDNSTYPSTALEYKDGAALVAISNGNILAIYRIGDGHVNGATNVTSYLVSKEYDRRTNTWGDFKTIDFEPGFDTRNQIAGSNELTGRIFCLYCQNEHDGAGAIVTTTRRTYMKYSDDDGVTWSARVNMSNYCPYPVLDNVPYGKIITFADGTLLISIYNYKTFITLKSTDNGATWGPAWGGGAMPHVNPNMTTIYTTAVASDDQITEPTIIKVSETQLVCTGRCIPTGFSVDGTVTFSFMGRRWAASTIYEVGRVVYENGKVYRCTVAGTSGSVSPTHTSGSAASGTATLLHLGAYTAWTATTAVAVGAYVETYSTYMYLCTIAGTTSTAAPFASTLDGNETQIAYFKSSNAGATWSSASKVTWTSATFRATTSPPMAIVSGGTVHIAWFARSPEFALYYVKMQARAFFENPAWAFSKTDGEPRQRLMRSLLFSVSNNFDWRIDCGYVNLIALPDSRDLLVAWYDKPVLLAGKTVAYSTIVQP